MQLAQLNIAEAVAPLDDPKLKEFVDNLERINALAESSEGFIWRLKDESGDATQFVIEGMANAIVNMSVWQDASSLKKFIYESDHLEFLQRKKEWFHKMKTAHFVMWWVEDGHTPDLTEAKTRLEYLQQHGESDNAFTFRYLARKN